MFRGLDVWMFGGVSIVLGVAVRFGRYGFTLTCYRDGVMNSFRSCVGHLNRVTVAF